MNEKLLFVNQKDSKLIALFGILLIGLFLRVYDLGGESIWFDEGYSIRFANLSLSQIFFLPENNPPLYYIILHWWINLFGDSEFSIRFPSVIFGFLSIYMIYKVGSQIYNKDVGILSSLLLGLSAFHIRYSQEARTYSLSTLLTLISIYFFISLHRKGNYTVLLGYIFFSTLLIYSHIYGLFIIIFQNIYFIALFFLSKETHKLSLKRWISIQIILIILFLPWIKIFMTQTLGVVVDGFWIKVPGLGTIKASLRKFSGGELLFLLFMILIPLSMITYEKIGGNKNWRSIFRCIESCRWKIQFINTDKICLLILWLSSPIILPFIISRFTTPIYHTKYTIVASLAFYLLVAKGINNISHKYLRLIIISVVVAFSLIYISGYYTKANKERWRDLAYYIDKNAKNTDLLLFNSGDCIDIVFNYYSKRVGLIKKPFPEKTRYVDDENIKELGPITDAFNRVWVIFSHSRDEKGLINQRLSEAYNLSYQKKYYGINVYRWDRRE